jgi:hypothetical protein
LFDVEHVLFTGPDDPKIREITTRMSRFACNLDTEQERLAEKAYIAETKTPIVFSRYTPDKVSSEKNVYLITKREKNGSRVFLAPGVLAFIMFIQKRLNEKTVKDAQSDFSDYFVKQIKGARTDNNDILIDGKKVMGMTILYNELYNTAIVRFVLTMKSEFVRSMTGADDFAETKYKNITGVCDETGMSEDTIRTMVNGFVETVVSWRGENDPD